MRKLGLIAVTTVLALGALGIAYAAWTDSVTIQGSVDTGDVKLVAVDYSGTWVYKLEDHGLANVHGWVDLQNGGPAEEEPEGVVELVSFAEASAGDFFDPDDADVIITFDNVFPCQDLTADVLLRYQGTVPVRLFAEVAVDPASHSDLVENLEVEFNAWKLPDFQYPGCKANIHTWLDNPENAIDIGAQVHECDFFLVAMTIHLPQDNDLMKRSGSFKARIIAVQWDEYDNWLTDEWVRLSYPTS